MEAPKFVPRNSALAKIYGILLNDKFIDDSEKFYQKGRDISGRRLRKSLMEVKKLADEGRKEISAIRNERKKL